MDLKDIDENPGEEEGLMSSSRKRKQSNLTRLLVVPLTMSLWVLTVVAAYRLGSKNGDTTPRLPTHEITKDAVKYHLTMLDDEFFATSPETLKYMGNPSPSLDEAWSQLLGTGFNFRVPQELARQSNFTSIEIADGSGDLWATTAFNHNLHCVKYLRQAHFPKQYPATWEIMKPQEDGSISLHADHCLENLRQAILCGGDMTLYHYYWDASSSRPLRPRASVRTPHVCLDKNHARKWLGARDFDLENVLLEHPTLGAIKPVD